MKISVIIPCYNEEKFIETLLRKVSKCLKKFDHEIIIVNDFSSDKSKLIIESLEIENSKLFNHVENLGKGASLRTGIQNSSGEIVIIQDADLEYDPNEYGKLIQPIVDDLADVVYGSRFRSGDRSRVLFFWHSLGNQFLTFLSNMFTNLNLTDMETCYKVFRGDILRSIPIEENRFGFEPEITAKISKIRPRLRIYEVGISYYGRTYEDGKKITWKDGFRALYSIIKYNLFR